MDYLLHIAILTAIFAALSLSLNLVAGYAGMLSVAQAAFYGIGAYAAAIMALQLQGQFFCNLLAAGALAGIVGGIVGVSSLRVRDDYFVMATFACQIIVLGILNNWTSVTGGPMGLSGIPQPLILGWTVSTQWEYLLLAGGLCVGVFCIVRRITHSPFGRVLKAIREDEVFAQSLGKNVAKVKIVTFAIGACLAGMVGAVYAQYSSFIDPSSFTMMESVFIVSIVIVGGAGSSWGAFVGAAVLVALPEAFRFLGLPSSVAANLRQILYGVLLVLFMMFRPQGFVGEYSFQKNGGTG